MKTLNDLYHEAEITYIKHVLVLVNKKLKGKGLPIAHLTADDEYPGEVTFTVGNVEFSAMVCNRELCFTAGISWECSTPVHASHIVVAERFVKKVIDTNKVRVKVVA